MFNKLYVLFFLSYANKGVGGWVSLCLLVTQIGTKTYELLDDPSLHRYTGR